MRSTRFEARSLGGFIGFGAMDVTKPYKFIGFGAIDVTKPCKFIGFGARAARTDPWPNSKAIS